LIENFMKFDKWNIKLLNSPLGSGERKHNTSKQVAVLMSGGIDSSITAYLLKEQGWDVFGVTMMIPVSCNTGKRGCCGADAALVCDELGIPHYLVDVTEPFQELIIEKFVQSYTKGHTPNPCVDCNTLLKFSLLWDFLEEKFGTCNLATGHYAKISKSNGCTFLGKAKDKTKDQSYFLHGITPEKLSRLILPLGEFTKERVRSIATELNLSVAEKSESMELCFAGEGDYRSVIDFSEINREGDITDMQGNKIATHKGIANYTLGQRQGIGYAGGKPLYVAKIDAGANTIALGTREDISYTVIRSNQVNILIPEEFVAKRRLFGKIRSYGNSQPCRIVETSENEIMVKFEEPQFAPCPGQKLVLYNNDDNIVTGGTIIP
jgi:tRNA-specific 2-thiouridylase